MTNSIPRCEHDVRENERSNVIQDRLYSPCDKKRYKPTL
jgi:hypothetical protein